MDVVIIKMMNLGDSVKLQTKLRNIKSKLWRLD